MRGWLASWRLALRLARRDLLKHRARAIIALVMVTLPVLGVVAADILIQTSDVSASEGISRRLGTAATALLEVNSGDTAVRQGPDPAEGSDVRSDATKLPRPTTLADIERVIGHRTMLAPPEQTQVLVRTPHGREPMDADQVDPTAPLARGLYRLTSGRWPRTPDEVVVNQAARDRGLDTTLTVVERDRSETPRTIVGTLVDASRRGATVVVGLPGAFPTSSDLGAKPGDPDSTAGIAGARWLVDGPPITWSQVQRLNAVGVFVTDRVIASHPDDYPHLPGAGVSSDDTTAQVAALIVVMALIEVVLLAGPAFAVGARKQQRSLALLVSAGGTPRQSRRVIIAGGLVLGMTAAVVGVVGGIAVAWMGQPVAQRFSIDWLGPFDVPWPHLAAVAAFGLVSALIACLVPAWIASRQNVVAVLAGRRGDAKSVRAFPIIGIGLFVVGVLVAAAGARDRGDGSLTIAWSAVICVLGMVLLVPVVVNAVARVAGRLPLPVRFAARDAVRHRTRTTPAVAAVAATVAGVVALGISTSSDQLERRETYRAQLAMGHASVTPSYDFVDDPQATPVDWNAVTDVVRRDLPGARVTPVVGLQQAAGQWTDVAFREPGPGDGGDIYASWTSAFGTDVLVSDGRSLPPTVTEAVSVSDGVPAALAAGRAVVFTDATSQAGLDRVTIQVSHSDADGNEVPGASITVPATVLYRSHSTGTPTSAILPPVVAQQAGVSVATVALEVDHAEIAGTVRKDLVAALNDLPTPAGIYVEHGFQPDAFAVILQWVLAALAAVLMLGGTLTAMFLALSDARPDLATLAAVGAAPRTRRSVAAAYTFVVAFIGALLGMVVGFVPGLAITWPLTAQGYGPDHHGPYVDVPWLLIVVVVIGLPILTALVVGACVRSRLPMVTRLT